MAPKFNSAPKSNAGNKQQRTISSFFAPKGATSTTAARQPPAVPTTELVDTQLSDTSNGKNKENSKRKAVDTNFGGAVTAESETGQEESSKLLRKPVVTSTSSRRSGLRASSGAKKRDLAEDHDDDEGEDEVGSSTTSRRKKLRRSPSFQPEQDGDSESEKDKQNEQSTQEDMDVEMENGDEGRQTTAKGSNSSAGNKFRSLSAVDTIRKNTREQIKETTSRFRYNPGPAVGKEDLGNDARDDEEYQRQKEILHEKFLKKLKGPDAINEVKRRSGRSGDEVADEEAGYDAAEDEGGEEEEAPKATKGKKGTAASKSSKKGKSKLTPLEKQVVDIKIKHPDTVLVVEVGYKFRFFGEDARTAAKELSIMCIPGKMRFDEHPSEAHLDKFASASIPVPRLHVHVKRLVAAGHKVGIVRQLETAALKAIGDNRNAPFTRKLTNLYTKGTYIDEIDGDSEEVTGVGTSAPATGYLLCLTEKLGGGTGADEKVHVGIVAVQPGTGDVIYDEFDDGFMRSEIETRLLHIAPCELLIVGDLTKATYKLVTHLSGSTTSVFGDRIRVERVEKTKQMTATAASHISKFYADKAQDTKSNSLLDAVLNFPDLVTICLSAMITHMESYGLEHVFDLTKYFQSFSARSHMLLNGNTLSSLEIYRNQTDYTERGSLFWTLNRTRTKPGRRLLRKWVGRPLIDKTRLEERIAAVEEMKNGGNPKLVTLKTLLSKASYDLEKGLIRIYYGKCNRPELLSVLQTMHRIATAFPKVDSPDEVGFNSRAINEAIASLPEITEDVESYLDVFSHQAAGKDDKYNFFKEDEGKYDTITEYKMAIVAVEADLRGHLTEAAKMCKKKKVTYVTVSGIEFLIEIENTKDALKAVPANWVKISGTKKLSRFHTPQVIKLLQERDQRKEALAAECDKAFQEFLAEISTKYQEFRDVVQSLAALDCLLSLATVANQPNYVKPEYTEDICIEVKEGRHPMVEQMLLDSYVPNDIHLRSEALRAMLVTGPNMGGKSSFVRQVALIAIMGQIGSYVPASYAKLGLLDAVFTRMGAHDNMMAGESTFMVELSETSDILKQSTRRSLVILDELGRGTSTHDGVAIAHAVLDYVVNDLKSMVLFVTHYPLLAEFGEKYPDHVINAHMKFEEAGDGSENITFLYQVGEGVAHRSYGLNVARLAGIPKKCLETAAIKSTQLEMELKGREVAKRARMIHAILDDKGCDGDVDVEIERLFGNINGMMGQLVI